MAEMGKRKRVRRATAEQMEDEKPDRLSELPDNLIHHIMSFLDMKNAIQTCVLSKRWQRLWVSLPDLNFYIDHWDTYLSFGEFVLKVLSSRADSNIGKFRIHSRFGLCSTCLETMVDYLVSHNVQHLELCPIYDQSFCLLLPLRSCNSLKTLKLTAFTVDDSQEALRFGSSFGFGFGFTMLTSLNLSGCHFFCYRDDSNDPFASCPNLKNLCVRDCAFHTPSDFWKISGNQLLKLEIENDYYDFEIFAPKLTSLHLTAPTVRNFPSLELSSVDYVYISIGGFHEIWEFGSLVEKEDYSLSLINYFRGLCNAQVVSLSSDIIEDLRYALNYVEHQPSPFKRLKSLKVKCEKKSLVIPAYVKTYLFGDNPHEETISVESSTDAETIVIWNFERWKPDV